MNPVVLAAMAGAVSVATFTGEARAQLLGTLPDSAALTIGVKSRGSEVFREEARSVVTRQDVFAPAQVAYDFGGLTRTVSFATVLPGFAQFYGFASSPFPVDNPDEGVEVTVDIFRSYVKLGDEASVSYTYTAGELELVNLMPPANRCQTFKCMYAEVTAYAAVFDKNENLVWTEEQTASLFLDANQRFASSVGSDGSGSSFRNPDWTWIETLGRDEATFVLDGSYTANFDLSRIDAGEVFTVNYGMVLRAVDQSRGGPSVASALAVDPVTGDPGAEHGFELIVSGVLPVPEPTSWLFAALGLLAMPFAARRVRGRTKI
ncbi:MAG: hypothetical protein MUF30_08425 [Burkholderiales bacterium]|jgi:hypothetical protein|nr:hypothetical protein [Burkholderiales bacterium]